jgi:hypothetical protein
MKTIILILFFSITTLAQKALLEQIGELKANQETKKFTVQLEKDPQILGFLEANKKQHKPFALQEVSKLSELSFASNPTPSKKFSFSQFDMKPSKSNKMMEGMIESLGKHNIMVPEVKKLSYGTKRLKDEIIKALSEK